MAKYCPFGECRLCSSDCALRIDEECAFTIFAKSFRIQKIRELWSYTMNTKYGITQQKFNDDVIEEVSKHE